MTTKVNLLNQISGTTDDLTEGTVNLFLSQSDQDKIDNLPNNTQSELNNKVDKVVGKGLSTEDYTTTEKNKLAGIEDGAEVNEVNEAPIDGKQYARKDGYWSEVAGGTGAVDSVNGQTGVVVLDADDIDDTLTTNKFTNATDVSRLANTSGTNTGDQDLSGLALKSNVLELDNTTPFTPDTDYEPATKKYVDDNAGKVGTKEVDETDIDNAKILVYNSTSGKLEYETPSAGGSGGNIVFQDYGGQAVIGILGVFDAETTGTLVEATLICDTLPVGSNLICELRKNSTTSGNVLNATLQVTTTESATNGRYKGTPVTSFTSTAIADGDVFYAYLTGVGSTTPATNARLILRYS